MSEMMDVAHFLAQKLVVTFELPPPFLRIPIESHHASFTLHVLHQYQLGAIICFMGINII
jgi:hypothetical protein